MPELEKLLDEWAEKHAKLLSQEEPYAIDHEPPYGRFIRDGVVNMDEWKKQKLRVCMVLPEANAFEDVETHPNPDVAAFWNEKGSFTNTMLMMATWTRAVHDSVIAPVPYSKPNIKKHKNELIRSIAVVNMKKSDGHLEVNPDIVKRFAHEDAEEIRKEIEIIKANVIIIDDYYHSTLVGDRPENEEPGTPRKFVFYRDELVKGGSRVYKWGKNKLILLLWSPAQKFKPSASKLVNYYTVREICRTGIKSFQEPEVTEPKSKRAKYRARLKARKAAEAAAAQAQAENATTDTATVATVETPAETPQVETAKVETPVETPQAEAVKVETVETPQVETAKVETPAETPQVETVEAETPKVKKPRATKKSTAKTKTVKVAEPAEVETPAETPQVETAEAGTPKVKKPRATKKSTAKTKTVKVAEPAE